MSTYFVGFFYGLYVVNRILLEYPEYAIQALIALFSYVGIPVGVGIGFYSWKAKCENVLKYRKANPKETDVTPFDPANVMP
jgi:hypothetical protein